MDTISRPATEERRRPRSGHGRALVVAVLVSTLVAGLVAVVAAAAPAQAETRGGGAVAGYVMMGDSYSAGEGIGSYHPGTDDDAGGVCHRSTNAYGQVLATMLTADGKIGEGQWVSGTCWGSSSPTFTSDRSTTTRPTPRRRWRC